MANYPITTFNGGVLSPRLWDRPDVEKYQSGCRRLESFLVLKEGGVERRPGSYFVYNIQEKPEI